jgi:hypothetical protein
MSDEQKDIVEEDEVEAHKYPSHFPADSAPKSDEDDDGDVEAHVKLHDR